MIIGLAALLAVMLLTLVFGAVNFSIGTVFDTFFNFDPDNFDLLSIRDIRLPRFIADLIVGTSLSMAGAIMQGTTKNPMADSGIMGISSG